jgi:NAD(P)-dependent dehydrogenase (short-subunit alcohol dehydrogenase family)
MLINGNGKMFMEAKKDLRIYDGATAIITGGASGIGQAIAKELAKRGCEVVLADLQFELAQEVAARIRAAGGNAMAVKLDVTDHPAVERVVRDTVVRTGRLDYMFNNSKTPLSKIAVRNICHYIKPYKFSVHLINY